MKDLQFFILNENKRPMYENTSGNVSVVTTGILKPDGEPAHLEYSPDGWDDSLIKYSRNPEALGAVRDYSNPLKFVRDGANILKDSMWRIGTDVVRYLSIWKLNKFIFPDAYDHWYTGEFDFSDKRQVKDGFNITLKEGGLSKFFKANENTVYELDIHNDPEKKTLYMDGIPFTNKIRYQLPPAPSGGAALLNTQTWMAYGILSNEGTTQGVVAKDQADVLGGPILSGNGFIRSIDKSITVNIVGKLMVTGYVTDIEYLKFQKRNISDFSLYTDYFIISSPVTPAPLPYIIDLSLTVDLVPGDELFFEGKSVFIGGPSQYVQFSGDSFFEVTYDVTFAPSFIEGLSPKRVCQLLLDKISPGSTVSSTLLDSLEETTLLTSGQSLRKYGSESVLKTSIKDFLQDCKFYGIGWDYSGNVLTIEKHDHYFKKNKIANIGVVNNWDIYDAKDLMFNTFKFGYPNVEIDKVNGRDEFNVTTQFNSPVKRIVKEWDLVSPYHTGMYEIEVARIDLYGKDTTDSKVDNTVYKLNIVKGYTIDYYTGDIFLPFQDELQLAGTKNPLVAGDILTISGAVSNNISAPIAFFGYASGTTDITFATNVFTGTPLTINGTISVTSATNYRLNRPVFDSINGLLHPDEAFNIIYRPKNALYNNGGYLRSVCDYHDSELLTFTSGDRNSILSTVVGGVTVTENANEPIGGLSAQLFKPYYIKCDANISDDDWGVINSDPYALIDITIKEKTFSVYKWDGGRNPVTKKISDLIFLFGPDNDLTKLINL